MAATTSSATEQQVEAGPSALSVGQRREVVGFLATTLALLAALALWSFDPGSSANWVGVWGVATCRLLVRLFGAAAWCVPLEAALLGFRMFSDRPSALGEATLRNGVVVVVGLAAGCVLVTMGWPDLEVYGEPAGGLLGLLAMGLLLTVLGEVGAVVAAFGLLGACLAARTTWRVQRLVISTRLPDDALVSPASRPLAPPMQGLAPVRPAPMPITIVEPARMRPGRAERRDASCDGQAFELPAASLLAHGSAESVRIDRAYIERQVDVLLGVLETHGVAGRVDEVHPGPVVTRFEFVPMGTKVAKIAALAPDVALALAVPSMRVLAPVPGKAKVGFEFPNPLRQRVLLRPLLESVCWHRFSASLPLALGADVSGQPLFVDLAELPHLLVAGATGAGKSVGLNAMLMSLLFRCSPDDVRLILLDLKMVEFSSYADIPHLLTPVVTEADAACLVLDWAVREMERRYRAMAAVHARDLATYNRLQREGFPQIVIVVDEVADLMMVAPKEIELSIARLAQKARAAGIHLILATQRPSVDVITGTIKANFPARLAYKVSQREDSRTIISTHGAERLLGNGDALFASPGSSEPIRVHGAYIEEREVRAVCDHLRAQSTPRYDDSILHGEASREPRVVGGKPPPLPSRGGRRGGSAASAASLQQSSAELYERARQHVLDVGVCSITQLQGALGIGYARAQRLVAELEIEGIVGDECIPRREAGRPASVAVN
ncbi:MAG: hypothetical protein RL385_156 [Pseudomonadota bacterium]|jgi:S-DNA-T family DNA segregation ATPase FtsK/SpoIIIE